MIEKNTSFSANLGTVARYCNKYLNKYALLKDNFSHITSVVTLAENNLDKRWKLDYRLPSTFKKKKSVFTNACKAGESKDFFTKTQTIELSLVYC